ncbi:MAG: triose-phosphate isomerase [Micavibrio sp.]|nr:triose-phosphate isomerase [Micavibrio sp.]|tara:strand:- start:657 stop:1379 length:723 start_codon:yes stop_codon:yes gene_type:complete
MRKLIAGNWKMFGDKVSALSLATGIAKRAHGLKHDILVCPPFVYLSAVSDALHKSNVMLGGQDCAQTEQGAFTGDIAASQLKDMGCSYVILGHSERRQYHKESDALVKAKSEKALAQNLKVILCVGETEAQREAGQAEEVVKAQLLNAVTTETTIVNTVIAYEPVWAIGTGKTASLKDIEQMHVFIKETLASYGDFRILYGGSVKPENAKDILSLPFVDGALIGGASLKVESFISIAEAV